MSCDKEKDVTTDRVLHTQVVLDPVLTYIAYSICNSDADSIRKACRTFYTLEELNRAKDILWKVGDTSSLPPFIRRRDSTKGSEIDKVIEDIVIGMQKLDSVSKMPVFAADSAVLGRIPKAMPSEAHPISVCERLNQLEASLSQITDLQDRLCEIELKVEKIPTTYAAAAATTVSKMPSVTQRKMPSAAPAAPTLAYDQPDGKQVKLPPLRIRGNQSAENKSLTKLKSAATDLYGSQNSLLSSAPSMYDAGFEFPTEEKKKRRRINNRKAVTGTLKRSNGKLTGAPEPSRDIFVYRVSKGTSEDDIKDYIACSDISVRGVCKVSKSEAKFDSFRVEVKISDLHRLLDADFWPIGICVRRYFAAKTSKSE